MVTNSKNVPGYRQLPVWRDATRLLTEMEQAVRHFPRYHKYAVGSDLRRQAMNVCRRVARAAQCTDAKRKVQLLDGLVWEIEDIKMTLQLAKEVEAFASFAQFQSLAELAVTLGKQSGGWCKKARSVVQSSAPGGGA